MNIVYYLNPLTSWILIDLLIIINYSGHDLNSVFEIRRICDKTTTVNLEYWFETEHVYPVYFWIYLKQGCLLEFFTLINLESGNFQVVAVVNVEMQGWGTLSVATL